MVIGLLIDEIVLILFLIDVFGVVLYFVCVIKVDGNCLFYIGSVIVFGNDNYVIEIRVWIIVEFVLNLDLYFS